MLPRPSEIIFTRTITATCIVVVTLLLAAEPGNGNVMCREAFSSTRREQLAGKLRKITGIDLHFDNHGILRVSGEAHGHGSASARALIVNALSGSRAIVLEDASNSAEIAFCRVLPGRWKDNLSGPPAFVVQIDFVDFDQVVGDERALVAFNEGWGLLHEIDHIVNDSGDGTTLDETGECEANINRMRREINLPERVDYFYTPAPFSVESNFMTRFVRLAFVESQTAKKKKRYWITWDATVVGGLEQNQLAALR